MLEKLGKIGRNLIDVIIILVFIEAVMSTYPYMEEHYGEYFDIFNTATNIIFVVEILIRIFVGGKSFWVGEEKAWNWFDLIVTIVTVASTSSYLASIRSLRLFRLLRLLRVFTIFKNLRTLISGLLASIPKLGWLVFLGGAVMVIYAVIGCHLFREDYPELFGDFTSTLFTMFQLMTQEGWVDVCRSVMEKYPYSWIFFISYICFAAFVLLNALTGVMCSSMSLEEAEAESQMNEKLDNLLRKMDEMKDEIARLKEGKA